VLNTLDSYDYGINYGRKKFYSTRPLTLFLTFTHAFLLTRIYFLSLSVSLTHTHFLTHSLTLSHPRISNTNDHRQTRQIFLGLSLSLSLSLTLFLTFRLSSSLSFSLSLSLSLFLTLTLSLACDRVIQASFRTRNYFT